MSCKNKLIVFIVFLTCTSVLFSCKSTDLGKKFTPVEAGFMLEPGKSIAVISGHNDDNDIQLVELTIEKLSATGKFKVLSQPAIRKMIPRYPLNLNLIDFSNSGEKDIFNTPYLDNASKERIDAVQKLVKTDYILVVWIENMQSSYASYYGGGSSSTKWMFIMSRLITYPGGNVAGYSGRWNKDSSVFGDWDDFFKDASGNLVKDIIKQTK